MPNQSEWNEELVAQLEDIDLEENGIAFELDAGTPNNKELVISNVRYDRSTKEVVVTLNVAD